VFRLSGPIDDRFGPELFGELPPSVIIDLAGVKSITSPGVSRWSHFMSVLPPGTRLYLLRCPHPFIDQLNLVLNFAGPAEVISVYASYFCGRCLLEHEVEVDVLRHGALIRSGRLPPERCPTCGDPLLFEDNAYFRFLTRSGAKTLDGAASRLLARLGIYSGAVAPRPPVMVSKLVEDQVTVLRLTGDLDTRFRPARVATGLEGAVVLVLDDLQLGVQGKEGWSRLMEYLDAQCSEVALVDLPVPIAEQIDQGKLVVGRAQIHSVRVSCYCAQCDELATISVPLTALARGEEKVARCARRGHRVDVVSGTANLERLKRDAKPLTTALAEVVPRVGALFSMAAVESRLAETEGEVEAVRTQVGDYRIVRNLSEGGMAQIYLAARASLGGFEKPVALKVFRRELIDVSRGTVQMFLKEAKLCANLNHPNIVQIFDVGEEEGELYLAMEYIEGLDLRAVRQRNERPVPIGILGAVAIQIAAALEYAHFATDIAGKPMHIVHRDVSPQNILLGFDGRIKLIDFGIALAGAELTKRRDVVAGNVAYMSPEQCRGEPLDGRSDVFALGVVLHELLSGRRLFRRNSLEETMTAVLGHPVPKLPDAPPAIEEVVLRALERNRERRFQSARELERAFAAAIEPLGGASSASEIGAFLHRLSGRTDESTPSPVATLPAASFDAPPSAPSSISTRLEVPPKQALAKKRRVGRVTLVAVLVALPLLAAAAVALVLLR
jgi:serine/threonine protein kinase